MITPAEFVSLLTGLAMLTAAGFGVANIVDLRRQSTRLRNPELRRYPWQPRCLDVDFDQDETRYPCQLVEWHGSEWHEHSTRLEDGGHELRQWRRGER